MNREFTPSTSCREGRVESCHLILNAKIWLEGCPPGHTTETRSYVLRREEKKVHPCCFLQKVRSEELSLSAFYNKVSREFHCTLLLAERKMWRAESSLFPSIYKKGWLEGFPFLRPTHHGEFYTFFFLRGVLPVYFLQKVKCREFSLCTSCKKQSVESSLLPLSSQRWIESAPF